jgi:hypothetical protein
VSVAALDGRTRLALSAVAGGKVDVAACAVCRAAGDEVEAVDHPLHEHVDPFREALEPLAAPYSRCRQCGAVYELVEHRYEYLVGPDGSEDIFRYRRVGPETARGLLR